MHILYLSIHIKNKFMSFHPEATEIPITLNICLSTLQLWMVFFSCSTAPIRRGCANGRNLFFLEVHVENRDRYIGY